MIGPRWARGPRPRTAVPSHADRGLRIPVRLRDRAHSWRRAATSSGCACRGSTRRASSARCSTATRACFRLGPDGRRPYPAARRYLPGTMVLETSWGTRGGWIIVRDVLLIGPWHHEDELSHTHAGARRPTTTPTTCCCAWSAASTARSRSTLDCEPMFDYGRAPGAWALRPARLPRGRRHAPTASTSQLRLTTDLRLGFEGPTATARTLLKEGDVLFVALSWSSIRRRTIYDEAYERLVVDGAPLAALARPRTFPDHPWRSVPPAQRAHAEGPDVRADRRARSRRRRRRCPRRRGGERNWDYRYSWIRDSTFMLWGAVHARLRLGGRTTSSTSSPTSPSGGRDAADHVRHRRRADLDEHDARSPQRLRGRAAGPDRKRRVPPATSTTSGERSLDSVYLHTRSRDRLDERIWPILVKQVEARSRLARTRPRASGRSAASRSTSPRRR